MIEETVYRPENYWIEPRGVIHELDITHADFVVETYEEDPEYLEKYLTLQDRRDIRKEGAEYYDERMGAAMRASDKMHHDGWVSISMDDANMGILAVAGTHDAFRKLEPQILEALEDRDEETLQVYIVRQDDKKSLIFDLSTAEVKAGGLMRALNEKRRSQGILISDMQRRPDVYVHGHRRRA